MDKLTPVNISGRAKSTAKVTALTEDGVKRIAKWVRRDASADARRGINVDDTIIIVREALLGVIAIMVMSADKTDRGALGPFNPVLVNIASMLRRTRGVVGGREIVRFLTIDDAITEEVAATFPFLADVDLDDVDVTDYMVLKDQILAQIDDSWSETAYQSDQSIDLSENGNERVLTSCTDSTYVYTTDGLTPEELLVATTLELQGPGKVLYDNGSAQKFYKVMS